MSLFYKVKQYVNPKSSYNGFYYARAKAAGSINLSEIGELIQQNCSMKKSDVMAVLTELVEVMKGQLQDSKVVIIDGLGRFKLSLKTILAPTVDEFDASHIERVHVRFLPEYTKTVDGKHITALTQGVKIEQAEQYDAGINDNQRLTNR